MARIISMRKAISEDFGALKAPIQVVSPPHAPVPFAPELEDAFIPSPEKIADAVRKTTSYSQ